VDTPLGLAERSFALRLIDRRQEPLRTAQVKTEEWEAPFKALLAGTLEGQVSGERLHRCLCLLVELRVLQGQVHGTLEALVAVRELLGRQPAEGSLHVRVPLVAHIIELEACKSKLSIMVHTEQPHRVRARWQTIRKRQTIRKLQHPISHNASGVFPRPGLHTAFSRITTTPQTGALLMDELLTVLGQLVAHVVLVPPR
jgi:hypothetical protein